MWPWFCAGFRSWFGKKKTYVTTTLNKTDSWQFQMVTVSDLQLSGMKGSLWITGFDGPWDSSPLMFATSWWRISLKLTASSHLQMDGWKASFLLGPGLFSGAFAVGYVLRSVLFRDFFGTNHPTTCKSSSCWFRITPPQGWIRRSKPFSWHPKQSPWPTMKGIPSKSLLVRLLGVCSKGVLKQP